MIKPTPKQNNTQKAPLTVTISILNLPSTNSIAGLRTPSRMASINPRQSVSRPLHYLPVVSPVEWSTLKSLMRMDS